MRTLLILILLLFSSVFCFPSQAATINSDLPLRELIKLSPRSYAKATGQHLNLKQRMGFRMMKTSMKKAIRKNQHVTLGEFLTSKKKTDGGGSILILLVLLILMGFVVFVITFQDKL
jgi:hypothetical protein